MISTDAVNCATCGAEAKTGFVGDDFCRNIKRALCSNDDCKQSDFVSLQGGPTVFWWNTPTVDQWNEMQAHPERVQVRKP